MSSQHFVKEGQEPALFFLHPYSFALSQSLLEWSPFVMVTQDSLEIVLEWAIKIDGCIYERTKEEWVKDLLAEQTPVHLICCKDPGNFFSHGIESLLALHQQAAHVLVPSDFREWETAQHLSNKIALTLFDHDKRWICSTRYEKWLPEHTVLEVRKTISNQEFEFVGLHPSDSQWITTHPRILVKSSEPFWIAVPAY